LDIPIGAIRAVKQGKRVCPGQLRSSTLLPSKGPGSLQAFQHAYKGDIQAFLVRKGWVFKHDRGTDRVVLNISPKILKKLEQKFFDEKLTEEQQRQFGCVLMTVADIKSRYNIPPSSCTDLESYLNNAASISQLIRGFQDQLNDTGTGVKIAFVNQKADIDESESEAIWNILKEEGVFDDRGKINTETAINKVNVDSWLAEKSENVRLHVLGILQQAHTRESTYQYWQGFIRSLAEGQGKVDEMYRRKFGDGDSLTRRDPTQKYMSTKHDLAITLGIDSGNDYDADEFNKAINELEDRGHISRKVGSWSENRKKRYLVLGALHARYLEKHGVPTIPSDPDEFVAFKSKAIEDLKSLLESNLHENLRGFVDEVIGDGVSNEVFTNFIQFGSLGNKKHTRQVLKRQVKDSCVMPMTEAITAPDNAKSIQTVFQIEKVFKSYGIVDWVTQKIRNSLNKPKNKLDSPGEIYTYLYGLNRETNGASFSKFVNSIKQELINESTVNKDRYLKLFENREEEGLWLLSRFMQKGKVDDATAKEIFKDWIPNNCPKDRSDRLKTIFMIEAQNRLDYNRLCCLLGDEIEVERVLTEVPIRVGAGAAHYVVESASIPCLFKYLEHSNNKFKSLAAGALLHLAQDAENIKAIGGVAGGIVKLIECLDIDDFNLKRNAVGALWRLAWDAENRTAIREAGGIGKLIECLGSDELVLKINAAGALWYLALDADNRKAIGGVAGGIGTLIECLGSHCIDLKRNAAGALCNLALDADNSKAIGGVAGGIGKLINCLGSHDIDLKRDAAGALCNLAQDADNRKVIGRVAGGIGKLINCLDKNNADLKRNAAGALWYLAQDAENKKEIGISTRIKASRLWLKI